MKVIVSILLFLCLCSGIAGIAGIDHFSYSSTNGVDVTYTTTSGRTAMLAVFIMSGAAAFGCIKRLKFSWWLVGGGTLIIIGAGIVSAVMAIFAVGPTTDRLVSAVRDLAVCGLLGLFLWRVWLPKRSEFRGQSTPNVEHR